MASTPSTTPNTMPTLAPVELKPDDVAALSTEPVADAVAADEEFLLGLGSPAVTSPFFDTKKPRSC